ncbi:MAG: primosomal protein N' [Candidatus Zixiibacteriota bacterium]|nr:MAG: primosomal protein N' [candidate division Zixibacteria bacterium]
MNKSLVNIAIPGTPRRLFTYSGSGIAVTDLSPGQRVVVPFGRRRVIGYYIETAKTAPQTGLKAVSELLDRRSLFTPRRYAFLRWMADYYYANPGDVLQAALPPGLRKISTPSFWPTAKYDADAGNEHLARIIRKKGFLSGRDFTAIEKKHPGLVSALTASGLLRESWSGTTAPYPGELLGYRIDESLVADDWLRKALKALGPGPISKTEILKQGISQGKFRTLVKLGTIRPVYGPPDILPFVKSRANLELLTPTDEQVHALERITASLSEFHPILLYGITGSGKTLVYCHAARKVLSRGRTVLVLVPEIALAGTLLAYFRSFFADGVALMHSALRPKERLLIWQNIRNGTHKIVIGARSAIFAPLENPGLIIVDEEHDESYKQDDPAPRFQGRDAAVMLAKQYGIPVVLGSATPSLESFHNAESGRYELVQLTHRPEQAETPIVRLIDLKEERPPRDNPFFTETIISSIKQSLKRNHQVILYLNRRGFSPRVKCTGCGFTPTCPKCEVTLTYHRAGNKLMCHQCGHTEYAADACEKCGARDLLYMGTGTQKIEDKIAELFESARMVRLDSDSARARARAHIILSEFAERKYDILLGTQMVSKGIDFPDVALVGVLMADIGLDMPDFRASEKLFAKLIQVAGRSGRGIVPGEVIVQTFNPELELIDDAARQDYETFYRREIKSRGALRYPPFSHLVNFRLSGKNEQTVEKSAKVFRNHLEAGIKTAGLRAVVLGPAPCPLYRVRGLYRRQIIIKTRQVTRFGRFLSDWEIGERNFGLPFSVRLIVDVDPYDMM